MDTTFAMYERIRDLIDTETKDLTQEERVGFLNLLEADVELRKEIAITL